jgi:hypothetical protein
MSSDLLYSLGLDITDFKTSAKASKESADDIKKSFKGFKDVLAAGGVATAVLGFFSQVVDYAQNAKGKLDENTAAVKRFGDSIDEGKKLTMQFGALVLGTFNRLGEAIGEAINIARFGWSQWAKDQDALAASSAAADAAEQRLADTKKKNGAEFEKITAALINLKKQENDLSNQGLTVQETYNKMYQAYLDLVVKQANFSGSEIERRRLELQIAEAHFNKNKASLALDKEQSAEEIKRSAELAKQQKLLADQKPQKQEVVAETKVQLKTEEEITAELNKQRKEREKIVQLQYTVTDGTDTQTLSDRQLAELLTKTQKQLSAARVQNASNPFQFTNQGILKNRVDQLQDEMADRQRFRSDYARQGEGAFTNRSAFEEDRFRRYITPEDQQRQKDQANDISNISENLRRLINGGRG